MIRTNGSSWLSGIAQLAVFFATLLAGASGVSAQGHEQSSDTPSAAADVDDVAGEENALRSASLEITDAEVRIDLAAVRAVGRTRVRTEPGFVRVWFDEMTGWTSLDLEGDGGALRFVRARQGAGDSNVVIVRVGDGRRVPEGAVRVTEDGAHASISIAREALPSPRVVAPRPAVLAAPAPAPIEATSAVPAPSEPGAELATNPAGGGDAHELLRRAARSEGEGAEGALSLGDVERGGHTWTLLATTALLLLALAAMRFYQARRATNGLEPSIRIIAATRLSPKQQLVVVRALGQDHLLAVEPGRTERLISITTPLESAAPDEPLLELRLSREPGSSPASASLSQALAALPLSGAGMPALAHEPTGARSAATAPTLFARTLAALGLAPRTAVGATPSLAPAAPTAVASTSFAGVSTPGVSTPGVSTPGVSTPGASAPVGSAPLAGGPFASAAFASTPFGRELARLVDARAETPLAPAVSPTPGSGGAVAGLVRLRAQAQAGRA